MNPSESNFLIKRYSAAMQSRWDEFVESSRNGHFMFKRGYMDYHSDRFTDHSLMLWKNNKLMALLPANEDLTDQTLYSHQGLTFGGFILPPHSMDGNDLLLLTDALRNYARNLGFKKIVYKAIPTIYSAVPSQDDIYALWRAGAVIKECNLSSAINCTQNPGFSTLQRRLKRKADGLYQLKEITSDNPDWEERTTAFYRMLCECLKTRHAAKPVHSLTELKLLMNRFPENIKILTAISKHGGQVEAGIVLFKNRDVTHCQYIATSESGRNNHALPWLMSEIIAECNGYFDLGTSNLDSGRYLNPGLIRQKHSFGANGVSHLIFELNLPTNDF